MHDWHCAVRLDWKIDRNGVNNLNKKKIFEAVCLAVVVVGILFIFFTFVKTDSNNYDEQPTDNAQGTVTASDVEYVRTPDPKIWALRYKHTQISNSETDSASGTYYLIEPIVFDRSDCASFELLLKYNPAVVQFGVYPDAYIPPEASFASTEVTEIEPGLLRVVGLQPLKERNGRLHYEMFSFLVLTAENPDFELERISCKNANGEDLDCRAEYCGTSDTLTFEPDTQTDAVVTVNIDTPSYYKKRSDRKDKYGMSMRVNVQPYEKRFVDCVVQVLYDPQQVEYFADPIYLYDDGTPELGAKVTVQEPGKLLIKVYGENAICSIPVCFTVLSKDEIDLDISLVSYTDEGGVRENAQLVVDMPVKVPVVKDLSAD